MESVTAMQRAQRVKPFWHRFPAFFAYPFHPRALIVLVVVSAIPAFAAGETLLALAIVLASTLVATKFAFDILARTAEGRLDPPRLDGETFTQGYLLPIKQIAIYFVIGITTGLLFLFVHPLLGVAFLFAALFLLPASIMTLAFSRSLAEALSPGTLIRTVRATGWGYVALLGCLFLLNGGASTALQWFGQGLPPAQLTVLASFLQFYFTFVMFHLMGYLLYQYHDRLDYQPEGLEPAGETDPDRARIQAFIDEEKYDAAIAELRRLAQRDEDPDLRMWLHRVATLAGDDRALLGNAGPLLEGLIDAGRVRDATSVYRTCQDVDPEARPARGTDYLPLARMLVDRGESGRALRLASGFHRSFPDHPDLPNLYLLVAHILAEDKGQPEQARTVLDYIVRRFPRRPEAQQAEALRAAISA